MNLNRNRVIVYITTIVALSVSAVVIYEVFDVHKFHTSQVSLFCNDALENVGVTDTRSIALLKDYINNHDRFDNAEAFEIKNFFADTIHIANCTSGRLISKRYNGARSVRVEIKGKERVVTVLTENVLFEEATK